MVWEIVFMLLILKIPIVYLCVVVWWAIKAEPVPPDPTGVVAVSDSPPSGGSPTGGSPRRPRTDRRHPLRPHTPRRGSGRATVRHRGSVRS